MNTQELVDHLARTPLSKILIFTVALSFFRIASFRYILNTPKHQQQVIWRTVKGIGEMFDALIYAAIFIFMVIRPYAFQTFQIPTGSLVPTCMVGDFIGLNKAIYRYTDPKRGDIVVFHPPVEACGPKQIDPDGTVNTDFVKRLIGLPGDLVEIRQGHVFINDKPLWEPYRHYTRSLDPPEYTKFKILEGSEREAVPKPNWKLVRYKNELIPLNYNEFGANRPGEYYDVAKRYQIENEAEFPTVRALPAERIPAGFYLFMGDNRNGSFDGRGWGLIHRDAIIGRAEFIWLPISRLGKIHHVDNGEKPAPNAEIEDFLK